MSTEIIDFKTPSKLFELKVRGFVVLGFDLDGTTLIELPVYGFHPGMLRSLSEEELKNEAISLRARLLGDEPCHKQLSEIASANINLK